MAENVKEIGRDLRETLCRHERELDLFGERIREEIVRPVCRRYSLHFYSGNGRFYFRSQRIASSDVRYSDALDLL